MGHWLISATQWDFSVVPCFLGSVCVKNETVQSTEHVCCCCDFSGLYDRHSVLFLWPPSVLFKKLSMAIDVFNELANCAPQAVVVCLKMLSTGKHLRNRSSL